jgi:TldD protein
MRNTYIKPGKNSLDEIVGSIDKGYLLVGPENGEADANAEFMFGCGEAYEIVKGRVGRLVKNVTISGQAFDVLKSVDMVGNDFEFAMGSGACGKIQPAKVDGGGPSIKCKAMLGGR